MDLFYRQTWPSPSRSSWKQNNFYRWFF